MVSNLESLIDNINEKINLGKNFIMPGTSVTSSAIDDSRTVVRRLERRVVKLIELDTSINYGKCEKILGQIGVSEWKIITKIPTGSSIVANNYFWLHGRKPFKKNKNLIRELLRIRGSFYTNKN